jgi:hypothetical protein
MRWNIYTAVAQNHLGALIFVVCLVSNPEQCPQLVQAETMDQLALTRHPCVMRRWILGWVALFEIVCEMHVAHLLLILCSPNSEQTGSFMLR